jgi:hypothetical protein
MSQVRTVKDLKAELAKYPDTPRDLKLVIDRNPDMWR